MPKYRLYVMGVLHTETDNINVHQQAIDRVHKAGLLEEAREEKVDN